MLHRTMLAKRFHAGFSLVEVTAVCVIVGILVACAYLVVGSARGTVVNSRIQTDLDSINMAKRMWQLDHEFSGAAFAASEVDRFTALKSYLAGQRALTNLGDMTPFGKKYYINDIGVNASSSDL